MKFFKILSFILIFLIFIIALALVSNRTGDNYPADYLKLAGAINTLETIDSEPVRLFYEAYSQLNTEGFLDSIDKLYSENFYFNDTLKTINNKAELMKYLTSTGKALHTIDLQIIDHTEKENDVFIIWHLVVSFDVTGKTVWSESIGMTHLKLNEAGKAILHQDYWDSSQGFYQHVPLLGNTINWIRERM